MEQMILSYHTRNNPLILQPLKVVNNYPYAEWWIAEIAEDTPDVIYFFAYMTTDEDEAKEFDKFSKAMDEYDKNTTPGGTWICDGNYPCPYANSDDRCPYHD